MEGIVRFMLFISSETARVDLVRPVGKDFGALQGALQSVERL